MSSVQAELNPGKTRCSWISGFANQGFATLGFSPRVVIPFCKMSHMVGDVGEGGEGQEKRREELARRAALPGRTQARVRRSRRVVREESRRSSHASMEREERRERSLCWEEGGGQARRRSGTDGLEEGEGGVYILSARFYSLLFSNYLLV